MKLWLIERDCVGYDEHYGAIIRAKTEDNARELAESLLSPKGSGVWLNYRTTCVSITVSGEPCIILDSFRAG